MNLRSQLWSRRSGYRALAVAALASPALLLATPGAAWAVPGGSGANAVTWSSTAAAAAPSCPGATLCTFRAANYGGTRWTYAYASRPHGVWFFVGSGANDQISSIYNHRAWTSYFAKNCPADGNWNVMAGGTLIPNLNDGQHHWQDGSNANDSISSVALGTSTAVVYPAHGQC